MSIRSFYLTNANGLYMNVRVNENSRPTKEDYTLYYSQTPASLWYMHQNDNNTGVISLHNSSAFYHAYDIKYNSPISLSYNASEWKLTDGLSTCCLSIDKDNIIRHHVNKQNILYCCHI